jgi:energy-coupling factor transporter ATP-binding protein EcfA2
MALVGSPHHIKSINISNLFGRYSYTIPNEAEFLTDINILYGLNGSGKTTILRLVFHLLSPSESRGHRTAISQTPFSDLVVTLNDGTVISATKNSQLLIGPVQFSIKLPESQSKIEWNFIPGEHGKTTIRPEDLPPEIDLTKLPKEIRGQIAGALEERKFMQEISKLRVVTYMLSSDRMLQGDSVEESSAGDPRSDNQRLRAKLSDVVLQYRVASIDDALRKASIWVQTKVLQGSYSRGQTTSVSYQDVIKKIAKTTYRTKVGLNKSQEDRIISTLTDSILELEKRSTETSVYGFNTSAISSDILASIQQSKGNRLHLINSILEPYLGGLKAKSDVIFPIYSLLNSFVTGINKFFHDKELTYNINDGFKIYINPKLETKQVLESAQLSSGEQQLILLFCHVLTARDAPSVFIIDEPEISLNILWQRMLIGALQEIGKDSNTQFIFASHSMEILAKHKKRVVSLNVR